MKIGDGGVSYCPTIMDKATSFHGKGRELNNKKPRVTSVFCYIKIV